MLIRGDVFSCIALENLALLGRQAQAKYGVQRVLLAFDETLVPPLQLG